MQIHFSLYNELTEYGCVRSTNYAFTLFYYYYEGWKEVGFTTSRVEFDFDLHLQSQIVAE